MKSKTARKNKIFNLLKKDSTLIKEFKYSEQANFKMQFVE